jgi:hypothetical protein
MADATVLAGIGLALIDVDVAVFAGESGRTCALKVQTIRVLTCAPIRAGESAAEIDSILTYLSRVSGWALALVVPDSVPAGSAVQAVDTGTVVLIHFAILARESGLTAAVVS